MEQDWSQTFKRSGTFILDDSEMSTSLTTPATIRSSSTSLRRMTDSSSRPMSRSKIPSATSRRSFCMETSLTNGSAQSQEELALAVRQVEDTISPLARANNQIRDTLAELERSILALKTASNGQADSNIY